MSIVEKYSLPFTPDADTLHAFDSVLRNLLEKINAPETQTDAEKVDVLADRFGKDEDGKVSAETFVKDWAQGIVDYIGEDAGRTFHVLNAVTDVLVPYLRVERDYHKKVLAPATVTTSAKSEYRADYNALRKVFGNLASVVVAMDPEFSDPTVKVSNGTASYSTPGLKGPNTSGAETHGRYSKIYALSWNVDGEEIPAGTQLADISRMLWHGVDRIGKSSKDLSDLLDENVPEWTKPEMADATFEVNGHTVTISRTVED